jgi:hypothetical protein
VIVIVVTYKWCNSQSITLFHRLKLLTLLNINETGCGRRSWKAEHITDSGFSQVLDESHKWNRSPSATSGYPLRGHINWHLPSLWYLVDDMDNKDHYFRPCATLSEDTTILEGICGLNMDLSGLPWWCFEICWPISKVDTFTAFGITSDEFREIRFLILPSCPRLWTQKKLLRRDVWRMDRNIKIEAVTYR